MKENFFKRFKSIIGFVVAGLFIAVFVSFAQTWTGPTQVPPSGNVAAPLNVSSSAQSKEAGLLLNTGGAANGLLVSSGKVGIGTLNPSELLEVAGNVKLGGSRAFTLTNLTQPQDNSDAVPRDYVDAQVGGAGKASVTLFSQAGFAGPVLPNTPSTGAGLCTTIGPDWVKAYDGFGPHWIGIDESYGPGGVAVGFLGGGQMISAESASSPFNATPNYFSRVAYASDSVCSRKPTAIIPMRLSQVFGGGSFVSLASACASVVTGYAPQPSGGSTPITDGSELCNVCTVCVKP